MNTKELEIIIALHFDYRRNLIIPNVSWGFRGRNFETDLVVMTPSGYIYDVELKVSISDLRRDKRKLKWQQRKYQNDYRKTWFAMPAELLKINVYEHIPEFAGVIKVITTTDFQGQVYRYALVERPAAINKKAKRLTVLEQYQLARLGSLRVWSLKRTIREMEKANDQT